MSCCGWYDAPDRAASRTALLNVELAVGTVRAEHGSLVIER